MEASDQICLIVVAPFRSRQVGGEGISAEKRLRLRKLYTSCGLGSGQNSIWQYLLLIQFIEKHAGVVVI